jgi:glycosyltransferase involved in cell wall biosynthesis
LSIDQQGAAVNPDAQAPGATDDKKISVCIATHRRTDRLALLLDDLALQTLLPDEVVVVDNDAGGSARVVVEAHRARAPYALRYDIQPERNIAQTRNLTVALASGAWLAFIDDDERARPEWLERLMKAAREFKADGVLAPVEPVVPEHAPPWIRLGHFYDFPHLPEGATVPRNRMRFGNVLLDGARLRAESGPFDVRYGLMATVWTGDPARGHRIAAKIKSGTVGINMPYTAFPGIPFGGYKQSGFGRELALETLDLYLETKSVIVNTGSKPVNPFGL